MPRRLNYTGRKKINREDVSIQLRRNAQGLTFDASLSLAEYKLEKVTPAPQIYVEAYRGASTLWKRFNFGRYGATVPPADRSLDEFGAPEGILFRVKVSATGDDSLGRLLAEADAVRPMLPDEVEAKSLPMIQHVAADDIGDELWRVTDFDGSLPLLKVNYRVPMGVDQFLRDPLHRALIMPAVMRVLLTRILILHRDAWDEEDTDCWQVRWLKFTARLPGIADRPEPEEDDKGKLRNADEFERWIDDAIEAFSSSTGLLRDALQDRVPQEGQP